jgi:hypothetical protein
MRFTEAMMAKFEAIVTRHTDTPLPRYRVDFIGDDGDSVSVECSVRAGHDPSREQVVDEARHLLRRIADDGTGGGTDAAAHGDNPGAPTESEQLLPF